MSVRSWNHTGTNAMPGTVRTIIDADRVTEAFTTRSDANRTDGYGVTYNRKLGA